MKKQIALPICAVLFLLLQETGAMTEKKSEKIKIYDAVKDTVTTVDRVVKSSEEWKRDLSDQEYYILRKKGTERAFTGKFSGHKEHGIYTCAGCGTHLFLSKTKYDSGTGWPSYYEPVSPLNIGTETDKSLFMQRIEVHCARCDGHLGHVFEDGPAPTGKRYCINSASLNFISLKK